MQCWKWDLSRTASTGRSRRPSRLECRPRSTTSRRTRTSRCRTTGARRPRRPPRTRPRYAAHLTQSIRCRECDKVFRDMDLAMYHADKSGHDDFEESTEEIQPLTEEEKQQRLAERTSPHSPSAPQAAGKARGERVKGRRRTPRQRADPAQGRPGRRRRARGARAQGYVARLTQSASRRRSASAAKRPTTSPPRRASRPRSRRTSARAPKRRRAKKRCATVRRFPARRRKARPRRPPQRCPARMRAPRRASASVRRAASGWARCRPTRRSPTSKTRCSPTAKAATRPRCSFRRPFPGAPLARASAARRSGRWGSSRTRRWMRVVRRAI